MYIKLSLLTPSVWYPLLNCYNCMASWLIHNVNNLVQHVHDVQPQERHNWTCNASAMCNINTLRPRQNERHFADDIFKRIFLNANILIPIKISPKFVPKGSINNIPALVQIMAWRRPGDKPLSEPMMVNLPTHICVTRPQWVNGPPVTPGE